MWDVREGRVPFRRREVRDSWGSGLDHAIMPGGDDKGKYPWATWVSLWDAPGGEETFGRFADSSDPGSGPPEPEERGIFVRYTHPEASGVGDLMFDRVEGF